MLNWGAVKTVNGFIHPLRVRRRVARPRLSIKPRTRGVPTAHGGPGFVGIEYHPVPWVDAASHGAVAQMIATPASRSAMQTATDTHLINWLPDMGNWLEAGAIISKMSHVIGLDPVCRIFPALSLPL